jgi:hypothetical protein
MREKGKSMSDKEKGHQDKLAFRGLAKFGSSIRFLGYFWIAAHVLLLASLLWDVYMEYPFYSSGIRIHADIVRGEEAAICETCSYIQISYRPFDSEGGEANPRIYKSIPNSESLSRWRSFPPDQLLITYMPDDFETLMVGIPFYDMPSKVLIYIWSIANIILGIYVTSRRTQAPALGIP